MLGFTVFFFFRGGISGVGRLVKRCSLLGVQMKEARILLSKGLMSQSKDRPLSCSTWVWGRRRPAREPSCWAENPPALGMLAFCPFPDSY